MSEERQRARRRRVVWLGLVLAVLAVHALVLRTLAESRLGSGAADTPPPPMDIAFVQALAPSVPPVLRAPPPVAPPPARAASEPVPAIHASEAASAPLPDSAVPPEPAAVAEATAPAASAPAPIASAAVAEAPTAPAVAPTDAAVPPAQTPVAFDWPPSTRLSYVLTGQYRGPLNGRATVEWARQAEHYQVRLNVKVPPVFERRMISDGVLGPNGLSPRRYDQETEVLMQELRRETIRFEDDQILLPNGRSGARPRGVQDSASQFVQLTWLFLTQPDRLRVGEQVVFPVALPRRVGQWTYRISEYLAINLPIGTMDTYHIQPLPETLRPNELSVEIWVAPSLQYLPVRIQIRQDAETFLMLELASAPMQAAPATPPPMSPSPSR